MTTKKVAKEHEKWKPIIGYEGKYFISSHGRVKSKRCIRKLRNSSNGYFDISFAIKEAFYKKWESRTIHTMVAIAFIENPLNKPTVNHIDGNKKNNYYKNLEWATYQENIKHSFEFLGHKGAKNMNRRKTIILTSSDGIQREVVGVREAGRLLNRPYQGVQNVLKGKKKTVAGHTAHFK